jgi:hypothetical protein
MSRTESVAQARWKVQIGAAPCCLPFRAPASVFLLGRLENTLKIDEAAGAGRLGEAGAGLPISG